jgi:hypothetical protein
MLRSADERAVEHVVEFALLDQFRSAEGGEFVEEHAADAPRVADDEFGEAVGVPVEGREPYAVASSRCGQTEPIPAEIDRLPAAGDRTRWRRFANGDGYFCPFSSPAPNRS